MKCSASILFKRVKQVLLCLVLGIFFLCLNSPLIAETRKTSHPSPTDTTDTLLIGQTTIIQSNAVTKVVKAQIAYNKSLKEVDGYRIQIFSENGPDAKTDAANARLSFINKYSGMDAYLSYKQPYFKICVGDFKSQLDARTALLRILRSYPNALIVREKVVP